MSLKFHCFQGLMLCFSKCAVKIRIKNGLCIYINTIKRTFYFYFFFIYSKLSNMMDTLIHEVVNYLSSCNWKNLVRNQNLIVKVVFIVLIWTPTKFKYVADKNLTLRGHFEFLNTSFLCVLWKWFFQRSYASKLLIH